MPPGALRQVRRAGRRGGLGDEAFELDAGLDEICVDGVMFVARAGDDVERRRR